MPELSNSQTNRIEYIDYAKGVAIFLAVWSHSRAIIPWHIHIGTLANVLFFFMSGIFFKPTSLKKFFEKKPRQILIPFLTFYILAIPFCIVADYWDYRDLGHFDWYRLLDVFTLSERADYLSLNLPLWFLMTLFVIQFLSIALLRLPKPVILLLAITAILLKEVIFAWPTMFMLNHAIYWWAYFAIGYLTGRYLTNTLTTSNKFRICMIVGSLILVVAGEIWAKNIGSNGMPNILFHIEHFGLIGVIISILSFTDCKKWMFPINYMGKHSLEILGLHWAFIIPIARLFSKQLNIEQITPMGGVIISILTILIISPIIIIINNRYPIIIGKSKPMSKEGMIAA